jgi:hypothetical protein
MQLLHMRVDTEPWRCDGSAAVDAALLAGGSRAVDVRCDDLALVDAEHFSWDAYALFCERLSRALSPVLRDLRLQIYTDSTVDYHNWDDEYTVRHGLGSAHLCRVLRRARIACAVDAVCGSGFAAAAGDLHHFRARLSRDLRSGALEGCDAVVVIGGWNDLGHSRASVVAAVEGFCRLAVTPARSCSASGR